MATSECQFTHGAKTWDLSPLTKEDGYTFKGVDGTVNKTFTLNVCNGTQGCDVRTGLNGGGATMDDGTTCTAIGNVRSGLYSLRRACRATHPSDPPPSVHATNAHTRTAPAQSGVAAWDVNPSKNGIYLTYYHGDLMPSNTVQVPHKASEAPTVHN